MCPGASTRSRRPKGHVASTAPHNGAYTTAEGIRIRIQEWHIRRVSLQMIAFAKFMWRTHLTCHAVCGLVTGIQLHGMAQSSLQTKLSGIVASNNHLKVHTRSLPMIVQNLDSPHCAAASIETQSCRLFIHGSYHRSFLSHLPCRGPCSTGDGTDT